MRAITALALLLALVQPVAAEPPPSIDQALAILKAGKRAEAIAAFDAILANKSQDPSQALFYAARTELEDGNTQAALPRLRQLVKLRPSAFPAWELLIQADQAAGDLADRDRAINALYDAWRSAIDPQIRSRVSFARDRIRGKARVVLAIEALEPAGETITRYAFQPADQAGPPQHLILVRSDEETNNRWRSSGLVPEGTVVYHLDTIQALPTGGSAVATYEFYIRPPEYDKVRAKVVAILSGEAKPLSGSADPYWTDSN
jgi:tetratricopeptide (TPR) repeat protein